MFLQNIGCISQDYLHISSLLYIYMYIYIQIIVYISSDYYCLYISRLFYIYVYIYRFSFMCPQMIIIYTYPDYYLLVCFDFCVCVKVAILTKF